MKQIVMHSLLLLVLLLMAIPFTVNSQAQQDATEPPEIPIGFDAFTQWDRWPYLRIGVRAYMKSTFDRTGGNRTADAAHYIRQRSDTRNVVIDETGPGILWMVRHNHWHGSPWRYFVDGRETVVQETSTADPQNPVENSVYLPEKLFPTGLTWTWSITKGADLSWVPIPFEKSLELAYSRTMYGTGYTVFWKLMPDMRHLSRPLKSWTEDSVPPAEVLDLLEKSGTDIAPKGAAVTTRSGTETLAPWSTSVLLRETQAPATIRRLAFRVPEAGAEQLAKARIRIYWDDRAQPSVDAPLGLFFGTGSLMRTAGKDNIVKSFPMTVKRTDTETLFACYFPMPFMRNARIEISNMTDQPIRGIQWEVRHEPFTGAPNEVGLFHATYRDHQAPEPGHELELLDTRRVEGGGNWAGHLVGTTFLFTKTGLLNTLEGDPRFYFDDSQTPQVQGTGSEEWGGGGDYWGGRTMTLPFAGHPVGAPRGEMKTSLDKIHSAYRFLLTDLMPFGRNARITLEHGGLSTSQEPYETVAYWYGIPSPTLILTDALNIGDEDDEALHQYQSPDASDIQELTSRYEWGIDQLRLQMNSNSAMTHAYASRGNNKHQELFAPLHDTGRHTTTWSECTIELAENNLGVLLRRRMDLAYPNQRARVLVGNAEGAPNWQEVGIWYMAGGNTVVYGDPRAETPEEFKHLKGKDLKWAMELMPPTHIPVTSNRQWRDDEFMLPRHLTEGKKHIKVRFEFQPVELPLYPGQNPAEEAWTEYRYWVYCFTMPRSK
jgi:hypothetical protein